MLLEQKLNSSELKAENIAINFTDLVDDDVTQTNIQQGFQDVKHRFNPENTFQQKVTFTS